VGLVIQAILPFILFSGIFPSDETVSVTITGGTNVSQSPSYDYLAHVLLPMLHLAGLPSMSIDLQSRGWSTGGTKLGAIQLKLQSIPLGHSLPAFDFGNRGDIQQLDAFVIAPAGSQDPLREKLDDVIQRRIIDAFPRGDGVQIPFSMHFEDSRHPKRWYLLLVATSENGFKLGRDWLYDRKIRDEGAVVSDLATSVAKSLAHEIQHGGCVDEYMRDQLVVFQALAKGRSTINGGEKDGQPIRPSLHAETARWVVSRLLDVDFDGEGTCEGIGLVPGEHYGQRLAERSRRLDGLVDKLGSLQVDDN
jgi:RNA 3'-terminal phosphate cyclase (ATP)